MEKITYRIKGLHCAEEIIVIKKVLGSEPGIHDLEFNILHEKLIVEYDPKSIDNQTIILKINSTGMKAILWDEYALRTKESFWKRHIHLILNLMSALFLITGMIFQYSADPSISDFVGFTKQSHPLKWQTEFLYLLSIVCALILVLPKAFFSIRRLLPDMNLLMIVAIIGAIAIKEWFEGATVAFLFSLALLLEKWSVEKARKAISALMELAPKKARVLDLNTQKIEEKSIEKVEIGSTILVRPSEKIPLDAVISKGHSSVDQSSITGESIPIEKSIGDEVFAGTLNHEGALQCVVSKKADDTLIAKMIRLVEEARSKRSESETWVETFAKYYTPLMILFSILVMVSFPLLFGSSWLEWVYRGLILLVIACPCALVISTPVSIVSGLTAAARNGILIKGGVFLEEVGRLKALALDKTGTLTYGHPEVQKIVPLNKHTAQELMERAYALEKQSEHPLARAILQKAEKMHIHTELASNFQIMKGKGAIATFRGKLYWIGSHRFMHEMGQETASIHEQALKLEDEGHSVVAIGTDDHVCGLISIADSPRSDIRETIKALKREGIEHVVMLTGDNEQTAKALAEHAGVDFYKAELLPEDKVEEITNMLKNWDKVGMVGDGINDAPAMAASSVGIAMGSIGTDAAIETADIALMSDDLAKLPWLLRYSRRVLRVIKQNILFALGVKAIFIALALWNITTLWMAIAADTGATLIVIFNALRLLRFYGSDYK